jgi:ribonuclease HII
MIESQLLQSGIKNIAGVDEAGRGPCAGPLIIAAVILNDPLAKSLGGVKDSKQLSADQRDDLFELIKANSLAYSSI